MIQTTHETNLFTFIDNDMRPEKSYKEYKPCKIPTFIYIGHIISEHLPKIEDIQNL